MDMLEKKQYDNNFDPLVCFQTFVRSDLAWAFGSSVPPSSLLTRRARESHQTFALDFSSLLSQTKLSTPPHVTDGTSLGQGSNM
jgi:hypothetical protein